MHIHSLTHSLVTGANSAIFLSWAIHALCSGTAVTKWEFCILWWTKDVTFLQRLFKCTGLTNLTKRNSKLIKRFFKTIMIDDCERNIICLPIKSTLTFYLCWNKEANTVVTWIQTELPWVHAKMKNIRSHSQNFSSPGKDNLNNPPNFQDIISITATFTGMNQAPSFLNRETD